MYLQTEGKKVWIYENALKLKHKISVWAACVYYQRLCFLSKWGKLIAEYLFSQKSPLNSGTGCDVCVAVISLHNHITCSAVVGSLKSLVSVAALSHHCHRTLVHLLVELYRSFDVFFKLQLSEILSFFVCVFSFFFLINAFEMLEVSLFFKIVEQL